MKVSEKKSMLEDFCANVLKRNTIRVTEVNFGQGKRNIHVVRVNEELKLSEFQLTELK